MADIPGNTRQVESVIQVWFSKKEAAKYLRVSKSTIDNLESRGMLAGHRLYLRGRKPLLRFRREDLDNLFLRKQPGRPRSLEFSHENVNFS